MQYNKDMFVGKEIQLYPGDTHYKYGIIEGVNDLGWIIKITRSQNVSNNYFKEGATFFISHSTNFTFKFVD